MDSIKPLSIFTGLKDLLKKQGISIVNEEDNQYVGSSQNIIGVLSHMTNIEVTEEGIFYISEDGKKERGFIYCMDGREGHPVAHICKCTQMRSYLKKEEKRKFIWANNDKLYIIAPKGHTIQEIDSLDICQNCLKMIKKEKSHPLPKNTLSFVSLLKNNKASSLFPRMSKKDFLGRTSDWELVKRTYLEKNNYVCNHCGRDFSQFDKRYLLEVFHKNGIEDQNDESNLISLCPACYKVLYPNRFSAFRYIERKNRVILNVLSMLGHR